MPDFEFTSPEGKTYTVTGPDGATPEQAFQMLNQHLGQPAQPTQAPQQSFGLGDTWPARLAKSLYSAATLPGDVYQGKAAVPQSENMPGGENTQNIDRVTNLAAIGSPVAPGALTKSITPPPPSVGELKSAAKSVFNDPAIKSIQVSPEQVSGLASQINNSLTQQGFRPTTGSAPATFAEINRLAPPAPKEVTGLDRLQAEMNGQPIPIANETPKSITVDDLRAARRALSMAAGQKDAIGKATPEANAASQAIQQIDGFLNTVAPEIEKANANYSAAKQAEQLDFRSMRAEHRAAKTGSGSNIENTMRQEVDKLSNRGLTPQEQTLRNQIVEGDPARNALRKIGKLGFGDGVSMMYHAALAVPTGGATLPLGLAATIGRKIGENLTKNDIETLNRMIRMRSPLAQSMPPISSASGAPLLSSGQLTLPQILGLGVMPVRANQQQ